MTADINKFASWDWKRATLQNNLTQLKKQDFVSLNAPSYKTLQLKRGNTHTLQVKYKKSVV